MPETTSLALLLWCRVAGFGGGIFGLLWKIRLPTMLGVSMMLLSPNWPGGPVPRHCRTGCHQHTCSLAQQPGHELHEVPQGTLLLALGIVAVSSKTRWLRAGWHMALHTCGSQELEGRARHPLSRSVPSSLCLLLLWHQHVPRCIGVTDHSLCSLTPSVSSALFLADRAGQKRGPEGWDHQSSGRALGVLCLQGEHGSLTETFLYCARGYQAAQDN